MSDQPLAEALRQAMRRWPSGVVVVAARHNGEARGMTVSSFTSVSLEPPLVLVCIHQVTLLWPVLEKAGRFSVNLLPEGHERTSEHFAGQPAQDHAPLTEDEVPALVGALATIYCQTWAVYPGGSHRIVVGRVTEVRLAEGRPLLYWNRGYRKLCLEGER
ncbi:flavin reductase [Meiothermus sp. QL-1]|uniref:4-hydroxyphenylacetate 3-monooxygenase reductase subunit n=1 Tax=Meiothermus sp. QL-1 TaxID=2058095 RepID=UPI000E0A196B|nr:4-hydroxyphenylacetate 3-monooxygenase reductase subunit [Meiothermus sp. QL-1]RDI94896.1 flavin reductase [Meiothermus sp. QL-1]